MPKKAKQYYLKPYKNWFIFSYNDVWNNVMGEYKDVNDLTGIDGNVSVNPEFKSKFDFTHNYTSPLINSGNPAITNSDGSRSNIGIDGVKVLNKERGALQPPL